MYPLHVRIITCQKKNFSSQDVFLWESWRAGIKQQRVLLFTNSSHCTQDSEIFLTMGQVRSVGVTGRGWGGPLTWLRNLSGDIGKHSKIYNPGTHKCWSFSSCLWMYISGSCTSPRDRLYVNACVQRVFTCTDHPLSLFAGRYWPLA